MLFKVPKDTMNDAEEADTATEGTPGVAEVGAVPVDAHLQPELELDPEDMKETIEESGQAQAAVAEPGSELSSEVVINPEYVPISVT